MRSTGGGGRGARLTSAGVLLQSYGKDLGIEFGEKPTCFPGSSVTLFISNTQCDLSLFCVWPHTRSIHMSYEIRNFCLFLHLYMYPNAGTVPEAQKDFKTFVD